LSSSGYWPGFSQESTAAQQNNPKPT
jgi:hypothetical protein